MDKDFYRNLLILVKVKDQFKCVQDYAEIRINLLLQQLSTERDMDTIIRFQGAIAELRRFSTLREETLKGAE